MSAAPQIASHPPLPDLPLDAGIRPYVETLYANGIETFESCEGSDGHAFPEPTVCFHGDKTEGFRALAIAHQHALPVRAVRRVWRVVDGEPIGPDWEMTFYRCAGSK